MASLTNLPNEILLIICRQLPSWDIVNFAATCEQFKILCYERSLVRWLDFSNTKHYILSSDSLKEFLKPSVRYGHIMKLNLNKCYWLPAPFFRNLRKLHGLQELHLIDCRLSIGVVMILVREMQLLSLSCSFGRIEARSITKPLADCVQHLTNLTSLNAEISKIGDFIYVLEFLNCCPALENLVVLKNPTFQNVDNGMYDQAVGDGQALSKLSLPRLRSVIIPLMGVENRNFTNTLILDLIRSQIRPADLPSVGQGGVTYEEFQRQFDQLVQPLVMDKIYVQQDGVSLFDTLQRMGLMTIESIRGLTEISLSGAPIIRPSIESLNLIQSLRLAQRRLNPYDNPLMIQFGPWVAPGEPGEIPQLTFMRRILGNDATLRCTRLSVDFMILDVSLLYSVANRCTLLRSLSMAYCEFTGSETNLISSMRDIAIQCEHLTNWNLCFTWTSLILENPLEAVSAASKLTRLSLPVEWFLESDKPDAPPDTVQQTINQKRCGVKMSFSEDSMKLTRMWALTEGCPLIKVLTLAKKRNTCITEKVKSLDQTLATISQFEYLERLSLLNVTDVISGDFLVPILTKCRHLSSLHLINVGLSAQCVYMAALSKSLIHATALKMLRLHHPKIALTSYLCRSLECCPSLESLCLSNVVVVDDRIGNDLFQSISKLAKLMSLWVWSQKKITANRVRYFNSTLQRIRDSRPGFQFVFENVDSVVRDHRDSLYLHPILSTVTEEL